MHLWVDFAAMAAYQLNYQHGDRDILVLWSAITGFKLQEVVVQEGGPVLRWL